MNAWLALCVFTGAGLGALCRWGLGLLLNSSHGWLPWGTLTANWLGGVLAGVLLQLLNTWPATTGPHDGALLRALLMTGFLGGLTTFSTFSVEVVQALQRQAWAQATALSALHVMGSVLLTVAGWWCVKAVWP